MCVGDVDADETNYLNTLGITVPCVVIMACYGAETQYGQNH